MAPSTIRLMSLLSLLAACFGQKSEPRTPPPAAEYPRFPDTDVAGVKFGHVAIDDGYAMKTFFISPDKQRVYVLGYRDYSGKEPGTGYEVQLTDLRLFALDTKGAITHRLDLKRTDDVWGSSMGMIGDELLLFTGDHFVVIDPATFTANEKIPVWHEQHFPTKHDIELMTPDEQRDAYEPLMEAALANCPGCRWLEWPSGKYFVFAQGARGKRAAWTPRTYLDEDIAPLKQRFAPLAVSMNPHASADSSSGFTISDGAVTIREEDVLSGGTELDYPNYKNRVIVQYALTLGARTLHFSTTDRKRHDARIGFADNAYLVTADGATWVRYMGWLYRIE